MSVQYLGWWDTGGDGQNPTPAATQIAEQAGACNVTMNLHVTNVAGFQAAAAAGMKVVVTWPLVYYRAIDKGVLPMTPDMDAVLWWMNEHRESLAAIFVADEQDCNYKTARFPNGWTSANCTKARDQAEANIALIRSRVPGVPVWINYTAAMANWFTAANAAGRRLPSADWISLDCYTPWAKCFGTKSVEQLVQGIEKWMTQAQRIALIPQGMVRKGQDPAAIAATGQQYWDYAQRDQRVVAVMPFIYWTLPGAWVGGREVPAILESWAARGRAFLGTPNAEPAQDLLQLVDRLAEIPRFTALPSNLEVVAAVEVDLVAADLRAKIREST